MKGAGYSLSDQTDSQLSSCVGALWDGTSDPLQARSCEKQAMGKKSQPGTPAANFASKWPKA